MTRFLPMILLALPVCAVAQDVTLPSTGNTEILGEIWVDNWFALSVNGAPLYEDSTPYMTERSFNAERIGFNADLPVTLAFEFRDFKENDTGLEYIGSRRQQMGDGGAIAQFHDAATGALLNVTDASWVCLTVHSAPADASCAKERHPTEGQGACRSTTTAIPQNWTAPDFDDSNWTPATVHSIRAVSPKQGYDLIQWDKSAQLIWSNDLVTDNTVLCRATIE